MSKVTNLKLEICRENLRLAIALRQLNFAETARQAGLSRNAVSQFISGRTSLSYENMLKVCDVLNIPIGILHQPDAITNAWIRLYNILDKMPDNTGVEAFDKIRDQIKERG